MKKATLLKVGGVIATLATVSGVVLSQSALAQEFRQASTSDVAREFIGQRVYTPRDGERLKMAAAVLLNSMSSGSKLQYAGYFIFRETRKDLGNQRRKARHDWIAGRVAGGQSTPFKVMTTAEIELAKTIFSEGNFSGVKNIEITSNGIKGSVQLEEIGLTDEMLTTITLAKLKKKTEELSKGYREIEKGQ
jgi:hypothetical protein